MSVPVNLDMDVLRSFVAGIDLGSFAKAAERLGRSPSAVSLQLRKLEEQVGQPLVRKQGRGLVLTEAGETLMGYARRILDLNDEACIALNGLDAMEGWVRVGVAQDFAETWLPELLARFERAHPKVRVEARVDRGSSMVEAVRSAQLDLALTWGRLENPDCEIVGTRRVVWIAAESYRRDPASPLPLVAFDRPCAFRQSAVSALDAAGIEWRPSFATSSLAGIWAALTAGLGVTARTADGVPSHLRVIDPTQSDLPELGSIELAVHCASSLRSPADAFKRLLLEAAAQRGWSDRAILEVDPRSLRGSHAEQMLNGKAGTATGRP